MGSNIIQALQNCAGTAPARNDNGTEEQRSSMEACQDVSKIMSSAAKISHPAESRPVKRVGDDVAINNNDKRSIDPQPVSCQRNVLLQTAESGVMTDQNGHVAGQGRGTKRKFDNLEDRAIELETGSQQNRSRMTERIKPRVNDTPTTFPLEKANPTRSRIRNGRISMEGKPFWKRHASMPKYASFLRMFRKDETDDRLCNNSSRRNEGENSQQRRGISAERYDPEIRYNTAGRKKELEKFEELILSRFFFFHHWTCDVESFKLKLRETSQKCCGVYNICDAMI